MSYIESNLQQGESVVFATNLHWAIFIGPLIIFLIGFVAGDVGWLFFSASALMGIGAVVTYATTEIGVTTQRVMGKSGFLRRHSLELLLNRTESITVDQDILGRILGYGTITVSGTGATKERFKGIADPFGLRQAINRQIQSGSSTPPQVPPGIVTA